MTVKIKYREGEFGSLANNQDIGKTLALRRFKNHLREKEKADYDLRTSGDKKWGPMGLLDLMGKTNELIKIHHHPGFKVIGQSRTKKSQAYGILLTELEPPLTDTPGNDFVDLVCALIFEKFPTATNLGNMYCRKIDGSSSWSQHAFGNAQDFGAPSGANFWSILLAIANKLVENSNQLGVETVIVQNRIWIRGQGWHSYGGNYHYHVHTDGYPNGVGTPDCAR